MMAPPVAVNQEYECEIVGLNHEGEGVAKVDGFTVFVRGALPGEQIIVKVIQLKKSFGYGQLVRIVRESPERVAPACAVYEQCGGCQLQHLSYEGQLEAKRKQVADSLQRIGKLTVAANGGGDGDGVVVHETMGMANPWRYRNKAQVPVGEDESGIVGGFYAQGTHRIVNSDECLIQNEANDQVVRKVKDIAGRLGIPAYNAQTGRGFLRHVVVKHAFTTGETMLVLVTNTEETPQLPRFVRAIVDEIPGITSICQNVNPEQTSLVFGKKSRVLWGAESITDQIADIRFRISALSFYQVNPVQTEILYQKALDYAQLTGAENVIDAYCGIGTISLFLARKAKHVYGVEIAREAVEDAKRNAELNDIRNVTFQVGKAEDVMPRWKEQGIAADVVVVDPPRKGCDPRLLENIIAIQPRRVVYVSCNPATLARDLRILEDGGFRTLEVQPVDMFPHTGHVECVVLMSRVEK